MKMLWKITSYIMIFKWLLMILKKKSQKNKNQKILKKSKMKILKVYIWIKYGLYRWQRGILSLEFNFIIKNIKKLLKPFRKFSNIIKKNPKITIFLKIHKILEIKEGEQGDEDWEDEGEDDEEEVK